MIGRLRGTIAAISEDSAILDVGGVGYLVQAGVRTLAKLAPNEAAELWIETQVREDSIKLYGFPSEAERAWFAHLQTVQGVGARVALAILDALSPAELADAIALGDKTAIARANGVGPKLAARLATELTGKGGPKGFIGLGAPAPRAANGPGAASGSGARAEAVSALVNLGIDQSSASRAVASAAKQFEADAPAPDLIRAALKEVSR